MSETSTTSQRRQLGYFAGKTAIVTGAASGIGRALSQELAELGAHVVLADIDGAGAARAASALASASGSARAHQLDVRVADSVADLVDSVVAEHGHIDIMCNNAGVSIGGVTHEMQTEHWQHAIDVNLKGVVNGVLAAYPHMVARGDGSIVNTASSAGLAPLVFAAPYAATKHAVVGLSTTLRPEAALHGVRVNVLCPGAVDTDILDGEMPDLPPMATAPLTGRAYIALMGLAPMQSRAFARQALRKVARDKAVIVIPGSAQALCVLQRLSPSAVQLVSRINARRIQNALGA